MLSVIIPCYNDHSALQHTLESLQNQVDPGEFEIIVVDSSPIQFFYNGTLPIKYIHQSARVFAGQARNIGAKAARGDMLAFIDSKVSLEQSGLKQIGELPIDNVTIYAGSFEISPLSTIWGQLKHRLFFHEFQSQRTSGERNNLPGTCLILPRSVFLQNDGFGNLARFEDAEYTERMKRAGYRLLFVPTLKCTLLSTENLPTLLHKVYLDGTGYSQSKSTAHSILLPAVAALKFTRIGLRNIWWRRDFLSVLLFPLTICMSLPWILGGLTSFIRSHQRN